MTAKASQYGNAPPGWKVAAERLQGRERRGQVRVVTVIEQDSAILPMYWGQPTRQWTELFQRCDDLLQGHAVVLADS